jgi:hypothetical protein
MAQHGIDLDQVKLEFEKQADAHRYVLMNPCASADAFLSIPMHF